MTRIFLVSTVCLSILLTSCERKPATPPSGSGSGGSAAPTKPDAAKPDAGSEKPAPGPGHGGDVVELGEKTVDGMKVRTSRDAGDIKAGGDAPIDIWIDGGLGNAAAVRFWIGTEDAKGSLKAKAEDENGHWHTHGQIPDPLPADSKLWVEIEHKDGKKSVVSFDLKK